MNTKKNAIMRDNLSSIMTLDFFSKRFNIRRELMSWGLRKVTSEEMEATYLPVVIINGSSIFIDIKKDCFESKSSIYGRTVELLPVTMTETEDAYEFLSENAPKYIFLKEDLQAFYERKLMF